MGYYDELDDEIDQEMGWTASLQKGAARRRRSTPPTSPPLPTRLLAALLHKFRLPHRASSVLHTLLRGIRKIVFFPVISPLSYSKHFTIEGDMMVVKRSWRWRIVDALCTRLLLAPVIVAIFLLAVVYGSTHPERVRASVTPESLGIYFKRVRVVTADGQGLTAWYVPPVTAGEMSFNPEASLTQKWPAVILSHGLGASQEQYLSLSQDLHEAGFAVLMLDMRGQGESDAAAVTYGLRENLDVLAGVKYLSELPNIDPTKVCLVGHDIAAIASLQAATLNTSIAAIVADGMWPRFEDRARRIFTHPAAGSGPLPMGWLAPLYSIAFEVSIRDRLSQLDPEAIVRNIHTQPVLFIARRGENYAPIQTVLSLATSVGSHHEVMIAQDGATGREAEGKITAFLTDATHWKSPKLRGAEAIEKLLDRRVK